MTTRREALLALAALATLPACGGGGGGSDAGRDSGGGATSCGGTIADNHGHTLTVPQADVTAGTARTYDIQGTSPHAHTVSLSAADFGLLSTTGTVIVTSSTGNAHTHMVTVRCA